MSHLNERSVVTETTKVDHLSNLGLEGELSTYMPAIPKAS